MAVRLNQTMALICALSMTTGCGKRDDPPPEGPFIPAEISLKERGDLKELLDEKLLFVDGSGTEWIAPQGTLTDGASIPRLALPITDGRWDKAFLKAAVVHDAYCQVENENRTPEQYRTRTWQAVHKMFYQACIAGGTESMVAKIMFAGVWLAGPRWDDPDVGLQQVSSDVLTRGFAGSRKWIEENDPTVDEIVADMDRREPLLVNLNKLETGIQSAIILGNTARADALLRDEETLLRRELDTSPNDLMLLNFKGYMHKNRAELYRRSNVEDRAIDELNRSERTFNTVITSEPEDPGALKGLGNVSVLRGDLNRGQEYAERALRVAPSSEAAKRDLQEIERLRETRPPEQP